MGVDDRVRGLVGLVTDPATPTTGVVMVVGDRWSGRTHLLDQVVDQVGGGETGAVVVRAQGHRATRDVELGAFAELVGAPTGADRRDLLALAHAALHRAASPDRALVVAVDDAHLLDELSLAFLHQARIRARLVVTTVRPVPPALTELAGRARVVALEPLDAAGVAELAHAVLGDAISEELARLLQRRSDGLPGAVTALLHAAEADGTIRLDGGLWRLAAPLRLPDAFPPEVDRHLAEVAPEDHSALELLAVACPVPRDVAEQVIDGGSLARLDEGGLIEVRGDHLVPARGLVQFTLAQRCPVLRRRRHASVVADALEGRCGRDGDEVHRAALRVVAGDRPPVEVAVTDARRAVAVGAFDQAVELGSYAVAQDPSCRDAVVVYAEALMSSGRNIEAEALLADAGQPSGADDLAVWAMCRASNLFYRLDRSDEALDLVERTSTALADTGWEGEVTGLWAVLQVFLGRPRAALDVARPLLAEATGRGFVQGAMAGAPALMALGRFEEAAEVAGRGFEARVALGPQPILSSEGVHLVARAMSLAEAGVLDEAQGLAELLRDAAMEMSSAEGLMWAGIVQGRVLMNRGRVREAEVRFRDVAVRARDLSSTAHLLWARSGVVQAVALQGTAGLAQALADLDLVRSEPVQLLGSERERARAWAAVAEGDLAAGRRWLQAAAEVAGEQAGSELVALHDLIRLGDTSEVTRIEELGQVVQGPMAQAQVAHATGLAAGDAKAVLAAAKRFEALGSPLLAADAAAQAAALHRRQGKAQAAARATTLVRALRQLCPDARTPALVSHPEVLELSRREREVAVLAASGRSSKQIGQHLGIATRTVDNILASCYRKLDIGGRADLRGIFDDR